MHSFMLLFIGFFLSLMMGFIIIPRILVISHRKRLYDMPNERKVHTNPIPRLGGFAFLPAVQLSFLSCLGTFLYLNQFDSSILQIVHLDVVYQFLFLFVGIILLYLVGAYDDIVGTSYKYKFLVQIIAALIIVLSGSCFTSLGGVCGIYTLPKFIGIPFTILLMVFITNSINLIDGIDGLSSGLCAISLGFMSYIFYEKSDYIYALLSFCTLGILVPFWYYNVFGNAKHCTKIFMGDAGSLTLGYVLSYLLIHMCKEHQLTEDSFNPYLVVAFSLVLVPCLDVIRVFLIRIRHKKNPFLPDKNHIHHKFLRLGLSVRRTLISILFVSILFNLLNIFMVLLSVDITLIIIIDIILWCVLHVVLNYNIAQRKQK